MRLIDRLLSRASDGNPGYGEFMASGAAVTIAEYSADRAERTLPEFVARARHAYGSNGVVFGCILARMSLFAEARFKIQKLRDLSLVDSPALGRLELPWPNGTTGELLARMEQDVSMAGNVFLWGVNPELIIRLRPEWVTIISELHEDDLGREYRIPIGYFYDPRLGGRHDEQPLWLSEDEVVHWSPIPDPNATWRGMSWLTPILREVHADDALTEYKIAHLQNGAMPSLIVRYSQKLKPETVDVIRQQMSAKYAGPSNGGKTIVLDEGADLTVAGGSLEQLNFAAVQGAGESRIAMASGVPAEIAGLLTAADYQAPMRKFADMWARPQWRSACAALQKFIPHMDGTRLWFDTSDIAALQEGQLQSGQALLVKAQGLQAFVAAGYTRESAASAVVSGDLSQLVPSPLAPPPGVMDRETMTEHGNLPAGTTLPGAPQAGLAQVQPATKRPALPAGQPPKVGNGLGSPVGNGKGPGAGGGGH